MQANNTAQPDTDQSQTLQRFRRSGRTASDGNWGPIRPAPHTPLPSCDRARATTHQHSPSRGRSHSIPPSQEISTAPPLSTETTTSDLSPIDVRRCPRSERPRGVQRPASSSTGGATACHFRTLPAAVFTTVRPTSDPPQSKLPPAACRLSSTTSRPSPVVARRPVHRQPPVALVRPFGVGRAASQTAPSSSGRAGRHRRRRRESQSTRVRSDATAAGRSTPGPILRKQLSHGALVQGRQGRGIADADGNVMGVRCVSGTAAYG